MQSNLLQLQCLQNEVCALSFSGFYGLSLILLISFPTRHVSPHIVHPEDIVRVSGASLHVQKDTDTENKRQLVASQRPGRALPGAVSSSCLHGSSKMQGFISKLP